MTEYAPPVVGSNDASTTSRALAKSGQIGRLLYENGKLSADDVDRVARLQEERGLRFGEAAVALRLVTPDDVRMALAEQFSYPVAPLSNTDLDRSLTAALRPQSPRAEALRGLRSELMLRYFDRPEKRILPLVSIDGADEGGKLVANLAIVFSQLGARTLLVDCNLRQPSLHGLFGLPNRHGLSDILASRANFRPQLCSPLESLWLLNAGTPAPNPQELLANKRYRTLTAKLAEQFDVVLVNTPSLGTSLDAQLVANRAGAALIVAKEHVTSMRRLDVASRRLQEVGVELLGVTLSQ
ncbi:chain length determinant protein tyrosine kinase EpsG [Marinobacter nanhaiticus D15-8W]|uniref:Chain-length determining protein n=1 Tax=Marinobacter nanhaiticus D15-8W TaxID=626887 RepID=N6WTH0_9GAMM|nr:polysaccharide biosynthesis tyrosine autokinase [Marinobacter nanhaiticus]ENO14791.1 chain-length determining protein [Marinobacter nanhaiticus D15-8W]BES69520.1 chain length determinant protein tyrosine kinase EpsG [Marinobacter nanhaiticus D15-8W]